MTAAPVLSDRSSTLLDASPLLSHALGVRTALRVGENPMLPTLIVPAGAWMPPDAALLGPATFALAIVEGLLLSVGPERLVHGPGDHIAPWSPDVVWAACTPVRLAVLGRAFNDALRPHATARRTAGVASARVSTPGHGSLEDRMLALLWRLARLWGTLAAGAIALPRRIDGRSLAMLCDAPEDRVEATLAAFAESGTLRAHRDGGWLLPLPGADATRPHRDELSARMAEQFAVSRMASEVYFAIARSLATEHDRHERISPSSR